MLRMESSAPPFTTDLQESIDLADDIHDGMCEQDVEHCIITDNS